MPHRNLVPKVGTKDVLLGQKGPRVDHGASTIVFINITYKKIYIYFLTVIGN